MVWDKEDPNKAGSGGIDGVAVYVNEPGLKLKDVVDLDDYDECTVKMGKNELEDKDLDDFDEDDEDDDNDYDDEDDDEDDYDDEDDKDEMKKEDNKEKAYK